MLLFGFIIRIYHDARSPERHIPSCNVRVYELLTNSEARHREGRRLGKSRSQLPLV